MSSSAKPIFLTLAQTGFIVSSNDLSIIFLRTTVSSMAIARIFSPFFRLAALRTLAGMTTCPLEETLVVDASTMQFTLYGKNILTYNSIAVEKSRCINFCRSEIYKSLKVYVAVNAFVW